MRYKKAIQLPEFENMAAHMYRNTSTCWTALKGQLNEAQIVAEATLSGIMGRISAAGQMVRWRELVDETVGSPWYNLVLTPTAEDFEKGTVVAPPDDVVAIPGKA